jgi:hypothetical protein
MVTKVVNFISGAGAGKSLMSALTFAEIKMNHFKAEYVQEYAKMLIWQNRLEELDNQYQVSMEQYKMIKALDNVVDYIICDSGLLIGLFYNRYHLTNVCDIEKTEKMILSKMDEFENIYIFLERDPDIPYENDGRLQSEDESKSIDIKFKQLLEELKLEYKCFKSGKDSIPGILEYILNK